MKENTKLIEHIRILAKQHNVPCISSDTERVLTQHLIKYKPSRCIEIGSAIGCSTIHIAGLIGERNGLLTSFEISHPSYMTALRFQWQAQATNTTIYNVDILDAPLDRLIVAPIDFVFVDATKAHYHLFIEKILPYCAPTATIICDDVISFGDKVHGLYDRLARHTFSYEHVAAEEGDGLLIINLSQSNHGVSKTPRHTEINEHS